MALCQCFLSSVVSSWKASDSTHANSSWFGTSSTAPFKVLSFQQLSKGTVFMVSSVFNHSLCALLAFGLCSTEVLLPLQFASADIINHPVDEASHPFAQCMPSSSAAAPYLESLNLHSSPSLTEKVWEEMIIVEDHLSPSMKISIIAEDLKSSLSLKQSSALSSDLFETSSSQTEQPNTFLDYARVFSPAKAASLLTDIDTLETEAGWRLRVITKSGTAPSISGKDLKDLWKPDDKTVIVIEDVSSPNILNFNAGADVIAKLPRQFFLELQSRYGNQFFVQQEGEGEALMSTVQAIQKCLRRPEGCKNVPGLTDDLYYLTLVTSIVGGCVFGFAARLPPSGRVEASWQWVLFLSPLWLLLFVSFGILPVIGRTSELEPLLKNVLGFGVGAFALYLTPIFGPSPISKK